MYHNTITVLWHQSFLWLIACLPVQGMESKILDVLYDTNSTWDFSEIPSSETEDAVHYQPFKDSIRQTTGAESSLDGFKKEVAPFGVGHGDFGNCAKSWIGGALKSASLEKELGDDPKAIWHATESSIMQEIDPARINDDFEHWIEFGIDSPFSSHATHTAGVPESDTGRDTPVASPLANGVESFHALSSSRRSLNFKSDHASNPAAIFPESFTVHNEHRTDYRSDSSTLKQGAQGDTLSSDSCSRNSVAGHPVVDASGAGFNSDHKDFFKPEVGACESVISRSQEAPPGSIETSYSALRRDVLDKKLVGPLVLPCHEYGSSNHRKPDINKTTRTTRKNMKKEARESFLQNSKEVSLYHCQNEKKRKSHENSLSQVSRTATCHGQVRETPPLPLYLNGDKSSCLGQVTTENYHNYLRLIELCETPIKEEGLELLHFNWDLFDRAMLPDHKKVHLLSRTYQAAFKNTIKEMIHFGPGNPENTLGLSQRHIFYHISRYQMVFQNSYMHEMQTGLDKLENEESKRMYGIGMNEKRRPQIRDMHLVKVSKQLNKDCFYLKMLGTQQIISEVEEFMETLSIITKEVENITRAKEVHTMFLFYVAMINRIVIDEESNSGAKTGGKLNEAWKISKSIYANLWVPEAGDVPKLKNALEKRFLGKIMMAYQKKRLDATRKRNIVWHMLTIWLSRCRPELCEGLCGKNEGNESLRQGFKQMFNDIYIYAVGALIERHHQNSKK